LKIPAVMHDPHAFGFGIAHSKRNLMLSQHLTSYSRRHDAAMASKISALKIPQTSLH
jgi:hypothetical protein